MESAVAFCLKTKPGIVIQVCVIQELVEFWILAMARQAADHAAEFMRKNLVYAFGNPTNCQCKKKLEDILDLKSRIVDTELAKQDMES